MSKIFNTAAVCIPKKHYMVDLTERLNKIKSLIEEGNYFTINKARQYGKTTTLQALGHYLWNDYLVISMDFQKISNAKFRNENIFSLTFARLFLRELTNQNKTFSEDFSLAVERMQMEVKHKSDDFELMELFENLSDICGACDDKIVLMIDEIDSAADNQVFLDFLAQLRAYYINREIQPAFQSVILAGVHDVKNLKRKIRLEDEHKLNSPWNIATEFNVEMSFSKSEIMGMLWEYEADYHTSMNIEEIAGLIYDYTSGYPFLVSRLCKLIDEKVSKVAGFESKKAA